MITNSEDAFNDMRATFLNGWSAASQSIAGYAVSVLYSGNVTDKPPVNKCWVRISSKTVLTEQAALADQNGKRRDETTGLIFVQVFVPLSQPDGDLLSRRLCVLARKAFLRRSLSGTITFRRARVAELDADGTYHRRNVVAEYEYDELN